MRKFIIKVIIFVAIVFSYLIGVVYFLPVDRDSYIAATVDRHRNLERTPRPRIILIGGSSLAFGTDSEMIHRATGQNVVNMGYHGGLGIQFYANEIKPYLGKGDTVIAMFEHQLLADPNVGGGAPIVEVTIFYPRAFCYFTPRNVKAYFDYLPITFQRRLRGIFSPREVDEHTYRRSKFNRYGDYLGHLNVAPNLGISPRIVPEKMTDQARDVYEGLRDCCREKGAVLYIAFAPIMVEKGNTALRRDISARLDKLTVDMESLGIPIIGRAQDFVYSEDYFYDTIYHLNAKGRRVRMEALLGAMRQYPELFLRRR
ncbi:MAG: hypothetical protein JXA20_19200 [Spirochaetes bacterium]|nr:hypothetical protein [Spirochaetota bacterium]